MALTAVTLGTNTFLTLEDAKDWLRIPVTNTDHDSRVTRLINAATDMCEKYIEGPIKTRQFIEQRSGDDSDMIMPSYFPVRTVDSLRIDYNRGFGDETVIDMSDYVIQGSPDEIEVSIKGESIVLVSDGGASVLGSILSGSVVGSIQLTYTAGWGADQASIPGDLTHALLLTIEYYYMVRENRELNVTGKTTNGQSYSRTGGLPVEVKEILERYKDYTLGDANQPQKNRFSI